jgi:histone acetyltransferase (RNA polymerase elongator complex component)
MVWLRKKHIIPVFVPHMGCPFNCIFCDQKTISGQSYEMNREKMQKIVEENLATAREDRTVEIAFYGGSYTGIPLSLQEELLKTASEYMRTGAVESIRLSTRPDLIDVTVLKMLKEYGVDLIELGVQSMDDEVLKKCGRGHISGDVYRAVELIRDAGISFGIQTMIGLPGDTVEKAINTAHKVVLLTPDTVRIYPALVIRDTPLDKMYRRGDYTPLTLEEAVMICERLLDIYYRNNINVIRVGLQPTDVINLSGNVTAGPFHPAFRMLAETELMRVRIEKELTSREIRGPGILVIHTSSRNISNVIGYRRKNAESICSKFGFSDVKAVEDGKMRGYEFSIGQ